MTSRAPRVAVVGGSGVGLVFYVDRAPADGESVLAREVRVMSGGKGANQAIGAAYLGAATAFVSAVGDDDFRAIALGVLERYGVDLSAVVTKPDTATMVGAVIVDDGGDNRIVISPNALAALSADDVETAGALIADADVCLVSLEIPVEPALAALRVARRNGVTTILNPAPSPLVEACADLVAVSDFITPNLCEARSMTGGSDAEGCAAALLGAGAGAAVVTLGPDGALLGIGDSMTRVPVKPVGAVLDTNGAGDAFNAAFAVAIASGANVVEACERGCDAGARIIQGPGFVEALDFWRELENSYAVTP